MNYLNDNKLTSKQTRSVLDRMSCLIELGESLANKSFTDFPYVTFASSSRTFRSSKNFSVSVPLVNGADYPLCFELGKGFRMEH